MEREVYPYKKSQKESNTYLFTSIGSKGNIYKALKMTRLELPGLSDWYNLGFGDWDDQKMEMDDQTRSNNGDLRKILTTVLEIPIEFLTEYPTYTLAFQGSMDIKSLQLGRNQRNNAYKQVLDKNLELLSDDYKVAGILNGEIVKYEPNIEYEGFLVKRK